MNKILRELFFFALSCLSFILVLQSLPQVEERVMDSALDRELSLQKENHIDGRRRFNAEEKRLFLTKISSESSNGVSDETLTEKMSENKKNADLDKGEAEEKAEEDRKKGKSGKDDGVGSDIPMIKVKTEDGDYIDINRATEEELCHLKGIGPKLAKKIIEYREKNGEFMSIYDLTNVSGIGLQKLSRIQNQ